MVRIAGLVLVLGLALWHLLPLVVWRLTVAPDLRGHPQAGRLRVETVRDPGASPGDLPDDWERFRLGNVSLRVPADIALPESCASGAANCFVRGEGRSMNLFAADHLESYEDMVNLRAPDERDLSIWRASTANWDTIRALRDRVVTSRSKVDSFRFETPGVKAVVVQAERDGVLRLIVGAYRQDEAGSRGLAFSGFSREEALRMLASLEIDAR